MIAIIGVMASNPLFSQATLTNGWPQFRGNQRDGIVQNVELIKSWPETGPQKLWTENVGNGFSEVAVASGVAYIMSSDSTNGGYEYLAAFDVQTGKDIWKVRVDSLYFEVDGWGHGPRSTPAIDGELIFCLSGRGKLSALAVKDGSLRWSKDLPKDLGSKQPRWGFSTSPILVGDLLILETGGTENRGFSALDKRTGNIVWNTGTYEAFYNSPMLVEIENQPSLVYVSDTMMYSFDLKGNIKWSFKMPLQFPTAMPVFIAPDRIFVSSLSDTGSFMIRINNDHPKKLWTSPAMQNEWSSSIYHNGYLYGFSKAKLVCISAETGELKWGQRGFGKGSLIMAGDKLLVLSDQGLITVIEPSPEKYIKTGSFKAMEGKSWTAPSFAEGKLFVRNLSEMSCYKLTK